MNRIALIILALFGCLSGNAQYSFTISGGFHGNCAGVSGVAELNQQLQQIMGQAVMGFPDRSSCEQARATVNSVKAQAEMILYEVKTGKIIERHNINCSFSLSASPCTGRPIGGSSIGTPNILGVSQGTSFHSTNSTNEIRNWSSDDMERMLALNPNSDYQSQSSISTGDTKYDQTRGSVQFLTYKPSPEDFIKSLSEQERKVLFEKTNYNETLDFIHATMYQELAEMSTADFMAYCNNLGYDANRLHELSSNANYRLICSTTTEDGRKVQNVYVELSIPNEIKINTLHDIGEGEKLENVQAQIEKLMSNKEQLEKELKKTQGEVLYYGDIQMALELSQSQETVYITENLKDLAMRQIPLDKLGPIGDIIQRKVDDYFENNRKDAGIPDEPENKVAQIVEKVREIPVIDDVAKNYLGKYGGWIVANSSEIGKAIGHGLAQVNIFFQKKEWAKKKEEAIDRAQDQKNQIDMLERQIYELQNNQNK